MVLPFLGAAIWAIAGPRGRHQGAVFSRAQQGLNPGPAMNNPDPGDLRSRNYPVQENHGLAAQGLAL